MPIAPTAITQSGIDGVGNVVGADIHCHVTADHRGDHEEDSVDAAVATNHGEQHDADDEDQRGSEAEEFLPVQQDRGFDVFGLQHRLIPSQVRLQGIPPNRVAVGHDPSQQGVLTLNRIAQTGRTQAGRGRQDERGGNQVRRVAMQYCAIAPMLR
jgi:hypothetical protein